MNDFTDETHVTLADLQDPGAIERNEEDNGTVRYGNVLLLAPGIWGDAGSQRHILYSEDGIANSADNWEDDTVNLFHERENEVTDVGSVDTESVFIGEDDGGLYGDIVLHMDNPASEFADESLQNALETNGEEGLQGPSVELRGDDYRFNEEHGVHELVEGTFNGLGLVGLGVSPGPGSKDAAFAEQTRERAVALAETDSADVLTLQTNHIMDTDHILEQLSEHGVSVGDDPTEETLRTLAEAFDIELQDEENEENNEDGDGDGEEDEGEEADEGEDGGDGDEDVDINLEDLATHVDEMNSQVQENAERINSMAERFEDLDDGANLSDLFETVSNVSETLETLADAESVEELENRLADIEDETEGPTSGFDGSDDQTELQTDAEKHRVEMGPNAPNRPAFTETL